MTENIICESFFEIQIKKYLKCILKESPIAINSIDAF